MKELTTRQLEVVELVAHGLTHREVGQRLGIAQNTVKNHLTRAFKKLGARSSLDLAVWYHCGKRLWEICPP